MSIGATIVELKMKLLGVLLALACASTPCRGESESQFEFLPPDVDGTFSIGIYNKQHNQANPNRRERVRALVARTEAE